MASGGLSHFLVNEELDREVIEALRRKDHAALKALPAKKLLSGSSEIRNWIAVAAAVKDLKSRLDLIRARLPLSRIDGRGVMLCALALNANG